MAEDSRRLFLALLPDGAVLDGLDARAGVAHQSRGGRRMRLDTLHLTLLFLGDVPEARLPALLEGLESVRGEAFRLVVDRLGYWPHNRIAWAGCSAVPPALVRLVGDLRAVAAGQGLALPAEAFFPHITLLRKAATALDLPEMPALEWPVEAWVLVESRLSAAGPSYRRLFTGRLDAGGQG